ncbi:hypothetical protein L9F63_024890, partial [Diploptera punctata]
RIMPVSVNIDMSNVIWLLFLNENTSMELEEFFQDINIPFNCEFLLAHGNTTLLEIYRVGPNHPLQTYHFGKWSNTLYEDDPTGGDKNDNGTWTGVFGMFQRKEVDICYAPFSMTSKRMEVVDFSLPVLEIKTYLVIKKPITYELKWKIFLTSFTKESWIAIGVIMLALPVVYKMVGNIGRRYKEKRSYDINHIDAILITVTAFLQQGHSNVPKNTSLRLIFATVYLTAYFVLTCFSAAFITQMTLRSPDLPFNNFEEFLKDGTYHLGLLRKSAQMDYFKRSRRIFNPSAIWLKFLETENTSVFFNNKDIPFDCEFLTARPIVEGSAKYTLMEVYRVSHSDPLITYHFGNWDPSTGLNHTKVGFYERRPSLYGAVLKTAVEPGSSLLLEENSDEFIIAKNFYVALWLVLSKTIHF